MAAGLLAAGVAGTPAHAVSGGQPVPTSDTPFLASLTIGGTPTTGGRACTAVLIDPQAVLTATDCLTTNTTTGTASTGTGTTPPSQPTTATVAGGAPITVVSATPLPNQDLSLGLLATPVHDLTPGSIPTIASTAPRAGQALTVTGNGRTSTDWIPPVPHAATMQVGSLTPTTLTLTGAANPCKGDAGGPVTRTTATGGQLVGILTASWQHGCLGEATTASGARAARLDTQRGWIEQTLPRLRAIYAITSRYTTLGGASGVLGAPHGDPVASPDGAWTQTYANGAIYYTPTTGAHDVTGPLYTHYQAHGGPNGFLGYPTTDTTTTPDGIGRYNHFTGPGSPASIYWTPTTGAHAILGGIRAKWASLGWERSSLGYPTTDETSTPDGIGRYNHFTGSNGNPASIYWTPTTGAHFVQGAIRAAWASIGWERSPLGYPTSDEYPIPGGFRSDFQGGYIDWYFATGQTHIHPAPRTRPDNPATTTTPETTPTTPTPDTTTTTTPTTPGN